MNNKEFIEKFAEAIEREDEIKMEDEFRKYDEWSSIAYLSVKIYSILVQRNKSWHSYSSAALASPR